MIQHIRAAPIQAVGALIACVLLAAPAAAQKPGGPPGATPVVIGRVQAITEAPMAEYTGLIQPASKALLSADISGRLERLLKKPGDRVAKDEVVAVLLNPALEDDLAVRRARLQETEAQVRLSETQQERIEQLFEKKLISAQQHEDGRLTLAVARARLQSERIQVQRLGEQVQRMVIRSPMAGQVISSNLEVGQWITPNQPIFEIFNYDVYEVLVGVPGRLLPAIPERGAVQVAVPEIGVALTGSILAAVRHVDGATGNFMLRVGVTNRDDLPLSGMLARVRLPLTEAGRILTVPRDAIVRQGARTHVVLVSADNKAQIVPVEVKGNHGESVIVAGKGLRDGAPVVVRGNERLFPGMTVRDTNSPSKPASG